MTENEIKLALHELDAARSKKEKYERWSMKCKLWFALLAVAIIGVEGMEHSPISCNDCFSLIILFAIFVFAFDFYFLCIKERASSYIRAISEKLEAAGLTGSLNKKSSVSSPIFWILTVLYYIVCHYMFVSVL